MMQEMMGIPPDVMKEIMTGKLGPGTDDPSSRSGLRSFPGRVDKIVAKGEKVEDKDDEDMQQFMKHTEAELRGHGALDLGSSSLDGAKEKAITKTSIKARKIRDEDTDEEDELSSDDNIDNAIDVNLARNLLESLKAQAGTAGPGGNLMGMLGLKMPRDEYDSEDDQPGPSGTRGMDEGIPRIIELN